MSHHYTEYRIKRALKMRIRRLREAGYNKIRIRNLSIDVIWGYQGMPDLRKLDKWVIECLNELGLRHDGTYAYLQEGDA